MHPRKDWMFNQLADDRDHQGFRLPDKDSVDYGLGPGNGRPVYFATGKPQGLGKYKNHSTGVASTAGKFASAFALGANLYKKIDQQFSNLLKKNLYRHFNWAWINRVFARLHRTGNLIIMKKITGQMIWNSALPLIYALTGNKKYYNQSLQYSSEEKVTPWMGEDTAKHYEWYPFHNFGHYELAKNSDR